MKVVNGKFKRSNSDSTGRWAAVGPYYAMFPLEFALDVVKEYSEPGQLVLDPVAGRASSVYAAATQSRHGLGIEINPVGWVYAQAKLNPAPQQDVEKRLKSLIGMSENTNQQSDDLSEFFQICYSKKVLDFLLTARDNLDWESNRIDHTLMAFLLIYLHGKLGEGLSNQMRQTKAMGPKYSVEWWKELEFKPPEIDLEEFLIKRIRWHYAKGPPRVTSPSKVKLGDSTEILPYLVEKINSGKQKNVRYFSLHHPIKGEQTITTING